MQMRPGVVVRNTGKSLPNFMIDASFRRRDLAQIHDDARRLGGQFPRRARRRPSYTRITH